ncbi:uncharacterized protein C11orf96-like isoform X1 [Ailuropoda melanoleuca]|uniref:uncharacterized protein C11orf96-like isoform X1 n=1 Tax=Ailuropoda melanoleuca TaxID=9646 RepID=UPI00149502EA|nr:uncharacterized protein C11orf96-like isoform X1 [Ailuropoda melanoleuca]
MPGPAPLPGEGAACGGWRPPRRRLSDRPRGPRGPRGPPAADPGLLCGRARGGRLRPSRPRGTRARAATGLRRRAACLVPTRGPKLRIPGPPPTSRSGPGAAKQVSMSGPADAPPGQAVGLAGYPRGASCLGLGGSLLPQCLADHYHRIPGIARQLPLRSEKTGEETVSSDSLSGPWVVRGVVRMCSVQVGGARADKLPLHTPSHADVKGAGSHAGPGRQP